MTISPTPSSTASSSAVAFFASTAHRSGRSTSQTASYESTITNNPEAAEFPEPRPQNFGNAQQRPRITGRLPVAASASPDEVQPPDAASSHHRRNPTPSCSVRVTGRSPDPRRSVLASPTKDRLPAAGSSHHRTSDWRSDCLESFNLSRVAIDVTVARRDPHQTTDASPGPPADGGAVVGETLIDREARSAAVRPGGEERKPRQTSTGVGDQPRRPSRRSLGPWSRDGERPPDVLGPSTSSSPSRACRWPPNVAGASAVSVARKLPLARRRF